MDTAERLQSSKHKQKNGKMWLVAGLTAISSVVLVNNGASADVVDSAGSEMVSPAKNAVDSTSISDSVTLETSESEASISSSSVTSDPVSSSETMSIEASSSVAQSVASESTAESESASVPATSVNNSTSSQTSVVSQVVSLSSNAVSSQNSSLNSSSVASTTGKTRAAVQTLAATAPESTSTASISVDNANPTSTTSGDTAKITFTVQVSGQAGDVMTVDFSDFMAADNMTGVITPINMDTTTKTSNKVTFKLMSSGTKSTTISMTFVSTSQRVMNDYVMAGNVKVDVNGTAQGNPLVVTHTIQRQALKEMASSTAPGEILRADASRGAAYAAVPGQIYTYSLNNIWPKNATSSNALGVMTSGGSITVPVPTGFTLDKVLTAGVTATQNGDTITFSYDKNVRLDGGEQVKFTAHYALDTPTGLAKAAGPATIALRETGAGDLFTVDTSTLSPFSEYVGAPAYKATIYDKYTGSTNYSPTQVEDNYDVNNATYTATMSRSLNTPTKYFNFEADLKYIDATSVKLAGELIGEDTTVTLTSRDGKVEVIKNPSATISMSDGSVIAKVQVHKDEVALPSNRGRYDNNGATFTMDVITATGALNGLTPASGEKNVSHAIDPNVTNSTIVVGATQYSVKNAPNRVPVTVSTKTNDSNKYVGDTVSVTLGGTPNKTIAAGDDMKDVALPVYNQSYDGVSRAFEPVFLVSVGKNLSLNENSFTFNGLAVVNGKYQDLSKISPKITIETDENGYTYAKVDYTGTGAWLRLSDEANTESQLVVQATVKRSALPSTTINKIEVYMLPSDAKQPGLEVATRPVGGLYKKTTAVSDLLGNALVSADTFANAYVLSDTYATIVASQALSAEAWGTGNTGKADTTALTSDDKKSPDVDLNLTLKNTNNSVVGNPMLLFNLPDTAQGDAVTLTLRAAPTLTMDNATDSQILYSLTRPSTAGDKVDQSSFVTADEITDWSAVKSILILGPEVMNTNAQVTAKLLLRDDNLRYDATKKQNLVTVGYADGLLPTKATATFTVSGTSTIHQQFQYIDKDGVTQTIALPDAMFGTANMKDNQATLRDQYSKFSSLPVSAQELIPEGYEFLPESAVVTNAEGSTDKLATIGQMVTSDFDGDMITMTLVHKTAQITDETKLNHVVRDVIEYVNAAGEPVFDSVVYESVFVRTGYVDLVTNEEVYSNWLLAKDTDNTDVVPDVASPDLRGYTASETVVGGRTVTGDSDDRLTRVVYVKAIQNARVIYQTTDGTVLEVATIQGESDGTTDYRTADTLAKYHDAYTVVTDVDMAAFRFDDDASADQTVVIILAPVVTLEPNESEPEKPINPSEPTGSSIPENLSTPEKPSVSETPSTTEKATTPEKQTAPSMPTPAPTTSPKLGQKPMNILVTPNPAGNEPEVTREKASAGQGAVLAYTAVPKADTMATPTETPRRIGVLPYTGYEDKYRTATVAVGLGLIAITLGLLWMGRKKK